MNKAALVIQHDPTISLGNLEPVLVEAGYAITIVDALADDFSSLDPSAADLVVVLGNEHGVYEKNVHPYIAAEESWLARRLENERPTLGVCFGAQIMASALGGEVYKGPTTEIGYRSVELTPEGAKSPMAAFAGVPVVEWHGDTFTLPDGVTRLAGSGAYANEAFAVGNWALATQFHPETTASMFEQWVEDSRESVANTGQSSGELLREDAEYSEAMQAASAHMLRAWLAEL